MRGVMAMIFALGNVSCLHKCVFNPDSAIHLTIRDKVIYVPLAKFDAGYMAWWSFVRLNNVHRNPVWTSFFHCMEKAVSVRKSRVSEGGHEPRQAARKVSCMLHRAVFLSRNPATLFDFNNCGSYCEICFESTLWWLISWRLNSSQNQMVVGHESTFETDFSAVT